MPNMIWFFTKIQVQWYRKKAYCMKKTQKQETIKEIHSKNKYFAAQITMIFVVEHCELVALQYIGKCQQYFLC